MKNVSMAALAFVAFSGCDNAPPDRVYEYVETESARAAGDVGEFGPCRYDQVRLGHSCRMEMTIKGDPGAGAWEYGLTSGLCNEFFAADATHTALLTVSSDPSKLSWVRYMDCPKGVLSRCTENWGQGYPQPTWRVECRR